MMILADKPLHKDPEPIKQKLGTLKNKKLNKMRHTHSRLNCWQPSCPTNYRITLNDFKLK